MLLFDNGFNDRSKPSKIKGKHTKEYILWRNMIARCYNKLIHEIRPTYIDCTVSDNFKSYSYFYEWCQKQVGFGEDGFELDKDLLVKGNKIYSEDNCVFLPRDLNVILTKRQNHRGEFPIGVHFNKVYKKYASELNIFSKKTLIGYYDSPLDAFYAYKKEKENHIKIMADLYKSKIDERAYESLLNYSVSIDD